MKNNDDLLSMQGNVYTLVDAEGYLVREDINGSRKRYPLTSGGEGGGGASYTEGEGIYISEENEINVDTDWLNERIDGYISDTDIYSRIGDLEDGAGGIGERLDDYESRLNYIEENFDGDQIYTRLGDLEDQVGNISDVIDLINGENI